MEKKVLSAMKKAEKPVRPGDVAKMIGADSKEVSKVISELKKKGKVAILAFTVKGSGCCTGVHEACCKRGYHSANIKL